MAKKIKANGEDTLPKVLLAPNEQVPFDSPLLKWPMFGSTKFDGNRNALLSGEFRTRSMKLQANDHLPEHFAEITAYSKKHRLVFDGEIWSPELTFSQLQEVIRAYDKPIPEHVGFYIFDVMTETEWCMDDQTFKPYKHRYDDYRRIISQEKFPRVFAVEQKKLESGEEAQAYFEQMLAEGHEGIMVRSMTGKYKHGRATHKEGNIFKFKNYVTDDAVIIECVEQQRMTEEYAASDRGKDEQGHTRRSSRAENFEPADTLGSLVVRMKDGTEVGISLGRRDAAERKRLWKDRKNLIGRWVELSHMEHGAKNAPRIGKLERFRPDLD